MCIKLKNTNEGMWRQGLNFKWKVEQGREDAKCRCNSGHVCCIHDMVRGVTSTVICNMGGGVI